MSGTGGRPSGASKQGTGHEHSDGAVGCCLGCGRHLSAGSGSHSRPRATRPRRQRWFDDRALRRHLHDPLHASDPEGGPARRSSRLRSTTTGSIATTVRRPTSPATTRRVATTTRHHCPRRRSSGRSPTASATAPRRRPACGPSQCCLPDVADHRPTDGDRRRRRRLAAEAVVEPFGDLVVQATPAVDTADGPCISTTCHRVADGQTRRDPHPDRRRRGRRADRVLHCLGRRLPTRPVSLRRRAGTS